MADRVYPSAKPAAQPPATAANGSAPQSFPPPKSQTYTRPAYRPQPPTKQRRRSRRCHCSFCCCLVWFVLVVLLLALIAAAAGGFFYLLYRPHRPTFSIAARLQNLNFSTSASGSGIVTSAIDATVTAKNPNKKLVYIYDDFSISAATASSDVPLGDASIPGFSQAAGNTTVIKTTIAATAESVDPTAGAADLKKSGAISVVVDVATKAGIVVGKLKTKKIGIQVHCSGIKVSPPPKKNPQAPALAPSLAPAPEPAAAQAVVKAVEAAPLAAGSCEVRVRVKIWKWTI